MRSFAISVSQQQHDSTTSDNAIRRPIQHPFARSDCLPALAVCPHCLSARTSCLPALSVWLHTVPALAACPHCLSGCTLCCLAFNDRADYDCDLSSALDAAVVPATACCGASSSRRPCSRHGALCLTWYLQERGGGRAGDNNCVPCTDTSCVRAARYDTCARAACA